MKSISKIILSTILIFLLIEFSTRTILFFITNADAYKYGFKKTVVFEVVDLSKLQINIIDKKKDFHKKKKIKNNRAEIIIFGGSTTFGYNCEQKQSSSWPEEIYKIDNRFYFKNFAYNGFDSDQSSILFWKYTVKFTPKIVMWAHKFNTLNVIGKNNYKNKKILNYEFSNNKKNNFFLKINSINKTLIDSSLFYSLLDKIILRINFKSTKFQLITSNKEDIIYALKNFEINTREAIIHSKNIGVKNFYLVSLFHRDELKQKNASSKSSNYNYTLLKYRLYDEIIKKIEHEYFPFVKIIDVKVDTNLLKKDVYLCDTIHQTRKGNEVQAQIIYQNLVNYSNLFK